MAYTTTRLEPDVRVAAHPRFDAIELGEEFYILFEGTDATVAEKALQVIEAAQEIRLRALRRTAAVASLTCVCRDPVCSKVHPVDLAPDPIDEAKRAREIDEADDEWKNREGMPEFNGSFR